MWLQGGDIVESSLEILIKNTTALYSMWKFITVPKHCKLVSLWVCGSCLSVSLSLCVHVYICACASVWFRDQLGNMSYEDKSKVLLWLNLLLDTIWRSWLINFSPFSYYNLEIWVGSNQASFGKCPQCYQVRNRHFSYFPLFSFICSK